MILFRPVTYYAGVRNERRSRVDMAGTRLRYVNLLPPKCLDWLGMEGLLRSKQVNDCCYCVVVFLLRAYARWYDCVSTELRGGFLHRNEIHMESSLNSGAG